MEQTKIEISKLSTKSEVDEWVKILLCANEKVKSNKLKENAGTNNNS